MSSSKPDTLYDPIKKKYVPNTYYHRKRLGLIDKSRAGIGKKCDTDKDCGDKLTCGENKRCVLKDNEKEKKGSRQKCQEDKDCQEGRVCSDKKRCVKKPTKKVVVEKQPDTSKQKKGLRQKCQTDEDCETGLECSEKKRCKTISKRKTKSVKTVKKKTSPKYTPKTPPVIQKEKRQSALEPKNDDYTEKQRYMQIYRNMQNLISGTEPASSSVSSKKVSIDDEIDKINELQQQLNTIASVKPFDENEYRKVVDQVKDIKDISQDFFKQTFSGKYGPDVIVFWIFYPRKDLILSELFYIKDPVLFEIAIRNLLENMEQRKMLMEMDSSELNAYLSNVEKDDQRIDTLYTLLQKEKPKLKEKAKALSITPPSPPSLLEKTISLSPQIQPVQKSPPSPVLPKQMSSTPETRVSVGIQPEDEEKTQTQEVPFPDEILLSSQETQKQVQYEIDQVERDIEKTILSERQVSVPTIDETDPYSIAEYIDVITDKTRLLTKSQEKMIEKLKKCMFF